MTYEAWPFKSFYKRTFAENELWWANCYVAPPLLDSLLAAPHWAILTSRPGCGRSVLLKDFGRQAHNAFVVSYQPERWPGSKHALHQSSTNHLPQMMTAVATHLNDYLNEHPQKAAAFSEMEREFLRWLFEKCLSPRAYRRLIRHLGPEIAVKFKDVKTIDDLSLDSNNPLDAYEQISEAVSLVQALGFQRLIFTIDIDPPGNEENKTGLAELFGWLELTENSNFTVVAAVPAQMLDDGILIQRARGRARLLNLTWREETCREIAELHLRQAVKNSEINLQQIAEESLLASMADVIVNDCYGQPTPSGWVALVETLLYLIYQNPVSIPAPIPDKCFTQVKRNYFMRHMPLRIDSENGGVWRGPKFLPLNNKSMQLLAILQKYRGHATGFHIPEMQKFSITHANLHSIAARTREVIEPFDKKEKEKSIYLHNKHGEGYWIQIETDL